MAYRSANMAMCIQRHDGGRGAVACSAASGSVSGDGVRTRVSPPAFIGAIFTRITGAQGTRQLSSGSCREFARPGQVLYVRAADETKEGPVSSWTLVYGQRMDSRYGMTVPEPEAVVQFSSFRGGWTTYCCSS